MRLLAVTALLQPAATVYFVVFWRWFELWRRRAALAYAMMAATVAALAVAIAVWRDAVFAHRLDLPAGCAVVGAALLAAGFGFGLVADRQLGLRVRAFTPLFEPEERIRLVTTGAYAVVRHPIYASGIAWQLGVFLVTGYPAVALAAAIFGGGAIWFTRQEERRLAAVVDDPAAYARYRRRVPALLPRLSLRSRAP